MKKLMIITVGTSIFHSACWDKEHPDFKKELGDDWQEYCDKFANPGVGKNPGGLSHPEKRRREGKKLEDFFKEHLNGSSADRWPEWVAPFDLPNSPALRYSAEIATILRFAENEAERCCTKWQKILEPYDFYFVHDSDTTSPSGIAGLHNRVYLKELLHIDINQLKPKTIADFSSKKSRNLMKALAEYRNFLNEKRVLLNIYDAIDVIISGGYKIYGLIAYGFLSSPKLRVIYMHEEAEQVVIQDKESIKLENISKTPFPAFPF